MSSDKEKSAGGMGTGRLIAIVVIVVAAALLIFGNLESTSVWLWGITLDLPLFVILLLMFVLGMLLGGVVRSGVRKLRGRPAAR